MTSLKRRVVHQRNTLVARSSGIRLHAERLHGRLRHPVVVVPAFLGGVLVTRAAPVLLRVIPTLTARLRLVSEELRKLDAIIKLIATWVPDLARLSGVGATESREVPDRSGQQASDPARET